MKKQGFTLVELIVTVTILAILATLGFFFMKGYTASARNAIRTTDIASIRNIVENEKSQGISLMAFTQGGQELLTASISGGASTIGTDYKAGEVLPSVLKVGSPAFEDPNEKIYRIGITTKKEGKYELGSIVEMDGNIQGKVTGDYNSRTQSGVDVQGKNGSNKVILDKAEDAKAFFKGDIISGTGIPSGTIIHIISGDGMTFSLDQELTSDITSIQLAQDETKGLIKGIDSTQPVVEGGVVLPY